MDNKEKNNLNIKNLLVIEDDLRLRDLLEEYLMKKRVCNIYRRLRRKCS